MSAPVDVLAVLDQAIEREKAAGQPYVAQVAARAAMAELIATLKSSRDVLATALKNAAPDLFETDEDVAEHIQIKRIDDALARCGGAA